MNVAVKPHEGLEEEKTNFIHLILEALGEAGVPPFPQCSLSRCRFKRVWVPALL